MRYTLQEAISLPSRKTGNSLRSEALIVGNNRNTGSGLKQRYEFLSAKGNLRYHSYTPSTHFELLHISLHNRNILAFTNHPPLLTWTWEWTLNQRLGSSAIAYSASKTLTLVFQGCKDRRWTCLRYRAGRATSVETLGITLVSDR